MRKNLVSSFISDIKWMVRVPVLLTGILYPFFIIILLLAAFPLAGDLKEPAKALAFRQYYSFVAISLISAIPFVYGLIFSYRDMSEFPDSAYKVQGMSTAGTVSKPYVRPAFSCMLCLIMVLPGIFLTDPVPTEGWLRSIYISGLLSLMAPFVFSFSRWLAGTRQSWRVFSSISLVFLVAGPAGLLLHHPWSYLAFFSPFYWISWAWIISSPVESAVYGTIALSIGAAGMLIFYRYYLKFKFAG